MSHQLGKIDGYSYYITAESDDDICQDLESSEDEQQLDEVDVFLYGTAKQKRKAIQRLAGDEASSSEDEFEKAMKTELREKMVLHEKTWMSEDDCQPSTSKESSNPAKSEDYDDIYFDSDEDANDWKATSARCNYPPENERVKLKKKKLTNDELFYDPFADERNQTWMNRKRLRGSASSTEQQSEGDAKASKKKDTVLTCPACLTTLCVDCQQHEFHQEQYRAMFVMNCKVVSDEILRYKEPKKKVFKRHRRKQAAAQNNPEESSSNQKADEEAIYRPVRCETCDTQVAVYDKDEIYYFFNVLAGPA